MVQNVFEPLKFYCIMFFFCTSKTNLKSKSVSKMHLHFEVLEGGETFCLIAELLCRAPDKKGTEDNLKIIFLISQQISFSQQIEDNLNITFLISQQKHIL